MSVEAIGAVRVTKWVAAEPQAVWTAWTTPDQMKKWACPAPDGVESVEIDLRVGGAYTILMTVEGESYTAFGTYREVEEPKRLVYTWDWREEPHQVGETTVTVEFTPSNGGTEISLVHEGFRTEEDRAGFDYGWGACLSHLEASLAG